MCVCARACKKALRLSAQLPRVILTKWSRCYVRYMYVHFLHLNYSTHKLLIFQLKYNPYLLFFNPFCSSPPTPSLSHSQRKNKNIFFFHNEAPLFSILSEATVCLLYTSSYVCNITLVTFLTFVILRWLHFIRL